MIDLFLGRKRLVAEPTVQVLAKRLEDRAYATYKARIKMHRRLQIRNASWNASLISAATATTIAGIGMLAEPGMYGNHGAVLFAALAVISLVASLVVANMNYPGRCQAVEANYKRIQQIALAAEALPGRDVGEPELFMLQREYEIALEASENHSDADYERTLDCPKKRWVVRADTLVSVIPLLTLCAPVMVAVPLIRWIFGG